MNKVLSDKKAILLFLAPAFLLFAAVVIVPICISFYYSLLDWDGFGDGIFVGFSNYIAMFTSKSSKFPLAAMNSLKFAGVSIFIQLPISLILALVISSGVKGEGFYRTVYFIPVIISTVVIGQLWMKIYNADYGLLNSFLRSIGLDSWTRIWLGDKSTALGATFVPILWQYVGYHMLLYYGAIKSITPDVFEAAKIDGASATRTSLSITIPMIRPMIRVSATFSLIGSLKVFDLIYVLTNGGPSGVSEVPTTLMYKTMFLKNQYGNGSAMAMFIVAECMILTVLIQRLLGERERKAGAI